MNLLVLLLIALPMCIAQFSIQGPSDGNRVAQGLTIQEGKGVQYTEQSEPVNGGFTIQGAQDSHSNVQSGSDGHTNFNIRGSSDAGAERYNFQGATTGGYNIQGATDGHSQPQSYIRGSYAGDPATKSLEYNDPSGSRVNWRSYDRQSLPGAQQQTQYSEAVAPAPRPQQRGHAQRQPQPQPQQEIVNPIPSKSLDSAPDYIKQLLQFQAQIPYVNIIPEPFRYDALVTTQEQAQENPQPQYQRVEQEAPEPRRPAYRGKPRGPSRHRRQAPEHRPEAGLQQKLRPSQPPAEPQYRYSTNLPPTLQQLLKFQAQTPYINIIPEQFRFNPEAAIQEQMHQVQSHYQDLLRQQPSKPVVQAATFGRASTRARAQEPEEEHSRQRRQAPHQQPQPQQLPVEPRPQYSTNLPSHIQNLLKYQAQIPYNIIANQISYRPEKPYIPQPVQPSAPSQESQYQAQYQAQQAQYQPQQAEYQPQQAEYQPQQAQYQPQQAQYQPQQAQYQPQQAQYQPQYQPQQAQYQPQYQTQADRYQGQSSGYNQQYNSQIQYPSGYKQSGNEVRPVNENNY